MFHEAKIFFVFLSSISMQMAWTDLLKNAFSDHVTVKNILQIEMPWRWNPITSFLVAAHF